jgi:hypothetical protein
VAIPPEFEDGWPTWMVEEEAEKEEWDDEEVETYEEEEEV